MHPPLAVHKHEGCEDVITALNDCHYANSFNKFLGFCNDAKRKVDQCLKEEFLVSRASNKAKATEKRERIRQIWKDMEEPPADFGKEAK